MKTIFSSEDAPANYRAAALELAIRAVHYMIHFAAMDTCNGMIKAVKDETLGLEVAGLIIKYADTFVSNIESSECASTAVANALRRVRVK